MSDPKDAEKAFRAELEALYGDDRVWIDVAVRLFSSHVSASEDALSQARARIEKLDAHLQAKHDEFVTEMKRAGVAEREAADLRAEVDRIRCPRKDREFFGMLVRHVWVEWAKTQPNPKPSWLQPWEELTEPEREVDRLIGERCAEFAVIDRQEQEKQ